MQDRSEIAYFSERLKCTPILLDSADLRLVNRPRLWWTRINWSQVRTNPITRRPMRWTKVDKLFRLHLDVDYTDASSIDTGDLQFHPSIVKHQTRIPCFTTPAPTSEGRSAPRSLRGKIQKSSNAGCKTTANTPLGATRSVLFSEMVKVTYMPFQLQ